MPVILRCVVVIAAVAMVSVACGNGDTPMADRPETSVNPTTTSSSIAEAAAMAPTKPPNTTTTPGLVFVSVVDAVTAEDLGAASRDDGSVHGQKDRARALSSFP